MSVLPVVEIPDPVLRQVAEPVAQVDDGVRALVADMLDAVLVVHVGGVALGLGLKVLAILLAGTGHGGRGGLLELGTLELPAERDNNEKVDADRAEKDGRDLGVGRVELGNVGRRTRVPSRVALLEVVTTDGLDLGRSGRGSVTKLVGKTGVSGTEGGRGDLGKVDGNDTPSTLNTELEEEGTSSKSAEAVGQDPSRDQGTGNDDEGDDGETTAEVLRDVTSDHTTGDGTDVRDDGSERGLVGSQKLGLL